MVDQDSFANLMANIRKVIVKVEFFWNLAEEYWPANVLLLEQNRAYKLLAFSTATVLMATRSPLSAGIDEAVNAASQTSS